MGGNNWQNCFITLFYFFLLIFLTLPIPNKRAWMGGVLNSLFNKNIDINSVFGKYKVNAIKYDISKYYSIKCEISKCFIR